MANQDDNNQEIEKCRRRRSRNNKEDVRFG